MNKWLKKKLRIIALALYVASCITACSDNLIATETKQVKVAVIDSEFRKPYNTTSFNPATKTAMVTAHPARYRVTVQYDVFTYDITDKASYEKYGYDIGGEADATLEIKKYSDGTVKHDIVSLD